MRVHDSQACRKMDVTRECIRENKLDMSGEGGKKEKKKKEEENFSGK